MSNYCENCGCKVYSGKCTNCDEESFILDQYYELGMEPPDEDSEFMKNLKKRQDETKNIANGKSSKDCSFGELVATYKQYVGKAESSEERIKRINAFRCGW